MKLSNLIKMIVAILLVAASGLVMLFLRQKEINLFASQGKWNHEISYQLFSIVILILMIGFSGLVGGKKALSFLRLNAINGPVTPVPLIGLKAGKGEGWQQVGRNFLIIISLVTGIVVFFQVLQGSQIRFSFLGVLLPAILFAVINSLVEEGIFRFTLVSVFNSAEAAPTLAPIVSAILFGTAHYFGTPGGFPGMVLAGFLGWFLAKSMVETGGFTWAWLIHAVQDVIIYSFQFMAYKTIP